MFKNKRIKYEITVILESSARHHHFFIGCVHQLRYEADITNEGVEDTAIVNDIYVSGKGGRYFEYQYDVNGVHYHERHTKAQPRWDDLKVGDSIVIIYKRSEPQKSISQYILGRKGPWDLVV